MASAAVIPAAAAAAMPAADIWDGIWGRGGTTGCEIATPPTTTPLLLLLLLGALDSTFPVGVASVVVEDLPVFVTVFSVASLSMALSVLAEGLVMTDAAEVESMAVIVVAFKSLLFLPLICHVKLMDLSKSMRSSVRKE